MKYEKLIGPYQKFKFDADNVNRSHSTWNPENMVRYRMNCEE